MVRFCRHGGKIVLGVIAGVLGLLWRWIKGKGDATRISGLVEGTLALEPSEINEVSSRQHWLSSCCTRC